MLGLNGMPQGCHTKIGEFSYFGSWQLGITHLKIYFSMGKKLTLLEYVNCQWLKWSSFFVYTPLIRPEGLALVDMK